MSAWVWIQREVIVAIHEMQLAEHGGPAGVRDAGLLDSALGRPQNLAAYEAPDAAALAAAYGWGISRNHPFIDGNKRTGQFMMSGVLMVVITGKSLRVLTAMTTSSSEVFPARSPIPLMVTST